MAFKIVRDFVSQAAEALTPKSDTDRAILQASAAAVVAVAGAGLATGPVVEALKAGTATAAGAGSIYGLHRLTSPVQRGDVQNSAKGPVSSIPPVRRPDGLRNRRDSRPPPLSQFHQNVRILAAPPQRSSIVAASIASISPVQSPIIANSSKTYSTRFRRQKFQKFQFQPPAIQSPSQAPRIVSASIQLNPPASPTTPLLPTASRQPPIAVATSTLPITHQVPHPVSDLPRVARALDERAFFPSQRARNNSPVAASPISVAPSNAYKPETAVAVEAISSRQRMVEELTKWAGDSENQKEAARRILEAFDDQTTYLGLQNLSLDSLPPCIHYLIHLEHLDLSYNQLQNIQIPDTLTHLTSLHLSNNQLQNIQIPNTLIHLEYLDLSDNQLQNIQIPNTLIHLERLHLSNNQLQNIQIPNTLIHLEYLNLSDNQLQNIQIPDTLTHLTSLHLSSNRLQNIQIPDTLTHLTHLYLSGNRLQNIQIPDILTHLTSLHLSHNQLQNIQIPNNFTYLEEMDLSYNQLQNIEIPITLTNLKNLNLSRNQLQNIQIPAALNNHLRSLNLSYNRLDNIQIPVAFSYLTEVSLEHNRFQNIPASLARLPSQCRLNLESNLLTVQTVQTFEAEIQQARAQSYGTRGPHVQVSIHDPHLGAMQHFLAALIAHQIAPIEVLAQSMNTWLEEYQKLESHEALVSSEDVIHGLDFEQQGLMQLFLTKLRGCPEYQKSPESLIPKVYRMLSGISQSPEFKQKAFIHIADAVDTCVDRAAIKLKDIDVLWDLILHPPQNEQEYALRLIGHKRLAELDKSAFWHALGKPIDGVATAYRPPDQISALFRFYIDGWNTLQLPASMDHLKFTDMAYASMGHLVAPSYDLTEEERSEQTTAIILQAAETIAKDTSSPDQQMAVLLGDEFGSYWTEYLERQFKEQHAAYFAAADQAFEAIDLSPNDPAYAKALAPVQELRQKASEEWRARMKQRTRVILGSN